MNGITGTMINYYFHCKRQCWLFSNRINLEDNSEDVRVGRVLHSLAEKDKPRSFGSSDHYDKVTEQYVVEMKKSDSDIEAAKWQLVLYLSELKDMGVDRKGRLEFCEADKQNRKTLAVSLDDETLSLLERHKDEIVALLNSAVPPEPIFEPKCKKCAYCEYCYI